MRGGPADPVLELMHRHRWCAAAVDPLEIAAGLEAHGLTDRGAAAYRHRDVFSLAEELFARVPREADAAGPAEEPEAAGRGVHPLTVLAHLLPALLFTAGLYAAGLPGVAGPVVLGAAALSTAAAALAVRTGPLRTARPAGGGTAAWAWTCWLLCHALCGPRAHAALLRPRPGAGSGSVLAALLRPDAAATAAFLGWTLALPAAAWCAGRFARLARGRLAGSRGLAEFATRARLLLAGTLGASTALLVALLAAAFAALGVRPDGTGLAGAAALGLLLLTARLLAAHGARGAAAVGLGAACAVEAAGLAVAAAARWCGGGPAGPALRALASFTGPVPLQAAACGLAAGVLTVRALAVLGRAGTHCFAASAADPAVPPDQENR